MKYCQYKFYIELAKKCDQLVDFISSSAEKFYLCGTERLSFADSTTNLFIVSNKQT